MSSERMRAIEKMDLTDLDAYEIKNPEYRKLYLSVKYPETPRVFFDCGNGIFRAPKHVETETVYILITHAHLDHVEGVRMCGQIVGDKCKKLIIYGIPEVISVIKSFFNQPFTWDGAKYNFELRTVHANETFTIENGAEIKTFLLSIYQITLDIELIIKENQFVM